MLCIGANVVNAQDTYSVVGTGLGDQEELTWTTSSEFGDMELAEGTTYVKTFKTVRFSIQKTLKFKVVKNHDWNQGSWGGTGTDGNYEHTYDPGVYDITITFNTSGNSVGLSDVGRMYIVKSTDSFSNHSVGNLMDYENGVHSVNFDATANTSFLIVPSWALNADQTAISKWSNVICPVAEDWYKVVLQHMAGSVNTSNNEKKWYFAEDANYTVTYYSSNNTFTIDAKKDYSIGSTGWATYSIGNSETNYGFKISGADAYYVSSTSGDKAFLTPITSGAIIPTKAGIMVNGSEFTIETTSTNGTNLEGNMLVGSGYYDNFNLWRNGQYVLKEIEGVLGFYPVDMDGSDKKLAPHKAFLDTNGASIRSFIGFGDEANNINSISTQQTNGVVYSLSGQRIAQPKNGLYIVDGKKVMIK